MRKLKTSDVFSAMRLIKESGMRRELQRIALDARNNKTFNVEELGADFILGIMEGLSNVNAEIKAYEFLSGPLEMEPEKIKDLSIIEWKNIVKEYREIESPEEWKDFFCSVASLMK